MYGLSIIVTRTAPEPLKPQARCVPQRVSSLNLGGRV